MSSLMVQVVDDVYLQYSWLVFRQNHDVVQIRVTILIRPVKKTRRVVKLNSICIEFKTKYLTQHYVHHTEF